MTSSFSAPPKAILVHTDFDNLDDQEDVDEFQELVKATGAEAISLLRGRRRSPDAKFFIGSGKVQEIADLVQHHNIDVVFFNHRLTPAQERNIEREVKAMVVDRVRIILDIFAQRARTFEGKLQVELAQLEHLKTRLVRGWTHLERQRGGIGLRGPGETQLETDRRLLRDRIRYLQARLDKVRCSREQGRRARAKATLPTISLIGYTNAGKSTLFNVLCETNVFVADQLFATLDPTLRRLQLPVAGPVILVDTVGFIRHLPTTLVDAFRATLEETLNADLLLHVVDAFDRQVSEKITHVNELLQQIGADQIPQLMVYNKIDLCEDRQPQIDLNAENKPARVWISAAKSDGIDMLCEAINQRIHQEILTKTLYIGSTQGKLRAQLYEKGEVLAERALEDGGWEMHVRILKSHYQQLFQHL